MCVIRLSYDRRATTACFRFSGRTCFRSFHGVPFLSFFLRLALMVNQFNDAITQALKITCP